MSRGIGSNLVNGAVTNMVQGVSQQPKAIRLDSQCEVMDNGYPSIVDGLIKRPPTTHIATAANAYTSPNAATHIINRDASERYFLMANSTGLKVWDLQGNAKTVSYPNGISYLSTTNPEQDLRFVTIADYTFVLNKKITVAKAATLSPSRTPEALYWIKAGQYGMTYSIYINDVQVAKYRTPDGSSTWHVMRLDAAWIARALIEGSSILGTNALGSNEEFAQNLTSAGITAANGWTVERYGSTIYIKRATDFSSRVEDGRSGELLGLCKEEVQNFSDLPKVGYNGFKIKVSSSVEKSTDAYYLQYQNDGSATLGSWAKTLKSNEQIRINAATMPHVLVRNSDGTFTFKQYTWADREIGDLETDPFPSFVDRQINDLFFFRNRLGVCADENIVFSAAGDFERWFRADAIDVLDDDPIDVAVSHTKVSIIRHAIPYNERMLLFSDQTQFSLAPTDILTPNNIAINQTTEFEASLIAKPVGAGRNVYFAVSRGGYSSLREYFIDANNDTNDALDVTNHVPHYIKGNITKIAASSNEEVIAVLTDATPNIIYIYKYMWNGDQKAQSAWGRFVFPECDNILGCEFLGSELLLIVKRGTTIHMEKLNLAPGHTDDGVDYVVHLDRRVSQSDCSVSYNSTTNKTTITLPYSTYAGEEYQVVSWIGGTRKVGEVITPIVSGNTLTVPGNLTHFIAGRKYEMLYEFTTFQIREQSATGGQRIIGTGHLQLRNIALIYNKSGYFEVEVSNTGRDKYTQVFSGRTLGSASNVVGITGIDSNKFIVRLAARNTDTTIVLKNASHLPSCFLSAEWEALYSNRSTRV